jgi:hypothetical protein
MSLTSVQIRPVSGSNLDINTTDGSGNHLYPLHEFEPEIDLDDTTLKKMQDAGVWAAFSYPGAMTIIASGEILGLGANDSAQSIDAMTKRDALINACLPPIDPVNPVTYTARKHGTLRVRYDHWSQAGDVDFHCILVRAPLKALSPGRCPYFINFRCFNPCFIGLDGITILLP